MKKVGIVTLGGFYNYGNKLQNYAVQSVFQKLDFKVATLDNCRKERRKNVFFSFIFSLFFITKAKKSRRTLKFYKFQKKYIHTVNFDEKKSNLIYDYIVCGSDQIWNPDFAGREFFFADFVSPKKRIAYSASFGVSSVPEGKREFYEKKLNEMKAISVREDDGAEIVKSLTGREATTLIDPTLMLDRDEWHKLSKKPEYAIPEKFICTYFLGEVSAEYREYIDKISKKFDMKVINLEAKKENDYWYSTGPSELLWLIENSSLVLTDSFHGTIFSVLMDTPFVVFDLIRKDIASMNSRIVTLLNTLKLEDRNFKTLEKNKLFEKNYAHVSDILEVERKKSIDFLKQAMELK